MPNLMQKNDYHQLVSFVPEGLIDEEISEKLVAISRVAASARGSD
jgi:hypothetical protein